MVSLIFIVIFNPSDCCLLQGNKVPSPCVLFDHTWWVGGGWVGVGGWVGGGGGWAGGDVPRT